MLTVSLKAGALNIRLTDGQQGTWMRLLLPDGQVSSVTSTPYCGCISLTSGGMNALNVGFLAGMRVEFSSSTQGPWLLAATTQAVPVASGSASSGSGFTLGSKALLTTTMNGGTVTVALTPGVTSSWMRLLLPDGTVSKVTSSPSCACMILGAPGASLLNFGAVSGIRVEGAKGMNGPWVLAATVN